MTAGARRVAVVGSGISGLLAAYLLSHRHRVVLYEAEGRLGGHTRTVPVEVEGTVHRVDTGFIVFNEENYPGFVRLLRHLGVGWRGSDMSFGVRSDRSGLEYGTAGPGALLARPRNLLRRDFLRLVRDLGRFLREVDAIVDGGRGRGLAVGEFFRREGYSRAFVENYALPMGASVWSSPPESFREFPVEPALGFLRNHGVFRLRHRTRWLTVTGGSESYVRALLRRYRGEVRAGEPVRAVVRGRDGEGVSVLAGGVPALAPPRRERFDEVVLACHADEALRLVVAPDDVERAVLGAFPYGGNDVVLHTDASILPRARRAWSSWNYRIPAPGEGEAPSVTYRMNRLQGIDAPVELLVTLNGAAAVDPRKVVRRFAYRHPRLGAGWEEARRRRGELVRRRGVSYAGAYWGYGFHEDGVRSALEVAAAFGVALADSGPVLLPGTGTAAGNGDGREPARLPPGVAGR